MAARWLAFPLGALTALLAGACAPAAQFRPAVNADALLADADREGLMLDDPLRLDPATRETIERDVGYDGDDPVRLRRLMRYLTDRSFGFEHERGTTLPAREAFRRRRGDCLTYAILFVALSRHLKIDTYFIHVSEVETFYDKGDTLYASSHLAVAYGPGPEPFVIDIAGEVTPWRMSRYTTIDDAAAVALYHNNLAVDALIAGDERRAERTLGFLLHEEPGLAELHNNYAVSLLRAHRPREALTVLDRALERFPKYTPLYTNAINAALGAQMPELARSYEARGNAVEQSDPLYLVARGIRAYKRGQLDDAIAQFGKAHDIAPDSVLVNAWLARAHLSAGHEQEGRDAFYRVKRRQPGDERVQELEAQFPELREH